MAGGPASNLGESPAEGGDAAETKKRHPSGGGQRLTVVLLLFSTLYDNSSFFLCFVASLLPPHDGDSSSCLRIEVLPLPSGENWRGYDSNSIHPHL